MGQLGDLRFLPWALALVAVCLVVPFAVPRLLDAWERRQDERAGREDPPE